MEAWLDMTYQKVIYNVVTKETTIEDYTLEEIAQMEKDKSDYAQIQENLIMQENARQEILAKIGLTPDEAKLIFQL